VTISPSGRSDASPAYYEGFKVGGRTDKVKIIVTGSRSDPNRASQPARQFILNNNVGMLLTADTPETVNPVAVMARSEAVPCAATNDPWESWQVGRAATRPTRPRRSSATFCSSSA
jgi:branched-chain amino acid transport system substrate-binding protein